MEDDGLMSTSTADMDTWERLVAEQTGLFQKTFARNTELTARVEELERELQVWKVAFKAAEDEKGVLVKKAARLERSIGALKDDNPLALCLIDGDGNIFSAELLVQGQAGGRRAAALLTQGLSAHMAELTLPTTSSTSTSTTPCPSSTSSDSGINGISGTKGRAQLWLTVYCNKRGLAETLVSSGVCSAEQFEDFVLGFNQAAPLFSFVDVGGGKEAADAKIKECLRVFTRFPQTTRVFFGGAHDNGYTSTLNFLHNEGLHEKLVILRGYRDLASEVKSLNLPHVDVEGVFMTHKLQTGHGYGHGHNYNYNHNYNNSSNNYKKSSPPQGQSPQTSAQVRLPPHPATGSSHPQVKPQDFDKFRTRPSPGRTPQADLPITTPTPPAGYRKLVPNLPLHRHKPPPCNFYYLGTCQHGNKCRYAHNYILLTEDVEELRENARKWPCPYVNRGQHCPHGQNCCMAHWCPKGPRCSFAKSGKCKFVARGMHNAPPDDSIISSQGPSSVASSSPPASNYSFSRMSPIASPGTSEGLELSLGPRLGLIDRLSDPYSPNAYGQNASYPASMGRDFGQRDFRNDVD